MKRFVEGADRGQSTLFPECLEDWIGEDNPVRVIDVFVEELELAQLGFDGVDSRARKMTVDYHVAQTATRRTFRHGQDPQRHSATINYCTAKGRREG